MKRLTLLFAAMVMVVMMSFGQLVQTFNFSTTVQKYIEVKPDKITMGFANTIAGHGTGTAADLPYPHTYMGSWDDAAYANCPFTITYTGTNDALDPLPILAKKEGPTGNGFDRLQTWIEIWQRTNVGGPDGEDYHSIFHSNPEGAATGTWTLGTVTFANAPHDGEIDLSIYFDAILPHKTPDFGVNNTWNQSADAGTYTCKVVATYAAL